MNYNYLLYFSVLAQTEHYTTAAARLGISQPALSSAIHSLENSLGGVNLFEKVGRNIRLTEEGRFYREMVDEAIQKLSDASSALRDSKTLAPVVIRLGMVSGTLEGVLANLIASHSRENKRVRFHLTEGSAEDLKDMLRQEKLDMAIVDSSDRDRSLHYRKLYERDFFVALPPQHPLAGCASLEPQQLAREKRIVFDYNQKNAFKQWASGDSAEESILCTVNTAKAALDLVSAGLGIAVIPGECVEARPGIRYVSLKNWHQALYACILYDKWLNPPVWDFVELVVKAFRAEKGL